MLTKDSDQILAIVCHDAGAANHIISWVRNQTEFSNFNAFFMGPGEQLWNAAFPDIQLCSSLEETLSHATTLLSGTGWASNIEHEARKTARLKNISSISLLDHWVNYRERFCRKGEEVLPDEIWVVDDTAFQIATKEFPSVKIKRTTDFLTREFVTSVVPIQNVRSNNLLYLLEPIRDKWGKSELGEFQALTYFLDKIALLDFPSDLSISLRCHPSEQPEKYQRYISEQSVFSIVMDNGSLVDAVSSAKWVAGCSTFAMTLALQSGRTVYSTLPPWAPPLTLPFREIIEIRNLVIS
jgi:hypothetical protein